MFLELFYGLRKAGVPVSMQEWQLFMTALEKGLHRSDLLGFYDLAKSCLVKSETYFDAFDQVFAHIFQGVEAELSVSDELLEWLNDPKNFSLKDSARGLWRMWGKNGTFSSLIPTWL